MDRLPAEKLAHELLVVLARGDMSFSQLAASIGVHPEWLVKMLSGEITELPLLTVMGICRRLRIMPEDIWDPGRVAEAFADFGPTAFDDPEEEGP